ncbi:XisI protein [Geminocystis sp. CENA526]|uniref:XisI protein n=1 Tax=Geminocystis sp. CENA526 TaxID=1355871 RepID=UPI003D6EDAB8
MDKLIQYREIVKNTILKYAQLKPSHGNIELHPVFDEIRDHYALMQVGWDKDKRVRGNILYLTIKNQKVYLEYDGIEQGISDDLINQGIDKSDLVIAFLPLEITV